MGLGKTVMPVGNKRAKKAAEQISRRGRRVDSEELILLEHDGRVFRLSKREIEAAHHYKESQRFLEEARIQLEILAFGYDDLFAVSEKKRERLEDKFLFEYGVSFTSAVQVDMLRLYIQVYLEMPNCGLSKTDRWQAAIKDVLRKEAERC